MAKNIHVLQDTYVFQEHKHPHQLMDLQEWLATVDTIVRKVHWKQHHVLLALTTHLKELPLSIAAYYVQSTQSVPKKEQHSIQM